MSLRARLLVTLGTVLAIAFVLAGLLLAGLVRASLVDALDRELRGLGATSGRMMRLADLVAVDDEAGRRLAVMRLDRQGRIVRAVPSGFPGNPDPLPELPHYSGGIPASTLGRIEEHVSADGSLRYRVLTDQVRMGQLVAVAAPMSGIDAAVGTLARTMALVGGLAMTALLVVGWFVIRHDLLPLERIAATAGRIAGGDLSQRAGVPHDDTEVGRLGAAFDTMLDQIQTSFDEQQAALEGKARSEERLRRFVADASHELRTPLTTVRGYADLYRAGGLSDPAELATAMDRIGTEGRRMGALVDDLLLLARLDQGRPLRRDPVDLTRIVTDTVTDAQALEPSRPISALVEPGVTVAGDEDRLRQVIGNLVANVRQHVPAEAALELLLRSDRDAAMAEVRVVDHGPGIASEHGANVFDRFYRADPGRSRDNGGTGLGLAIAAAVVAAQDGAIWYQATPGGGATFVVRLPLTAISQPSPGSVPATGASMPTADRRAFDAASQGDIT